MSDNIGNAIDALRSEQPNAFKDSINSELLSRLSSRIDLEKIKVAGQLFGTEDPVNEN